MTHADRHAARHRGQAIVEFALISPLSFLLFVGCLDFGRVFYSAMAVTHAARAGAQYGAQSNTTSVDDAGMTQAALDAAGDLPGVTVTPNRYCLCANGSTVDCITGTCTEGAPQLYVQVTAQKTFTTLFPYPGVPKTTNLSRQATIRLQ
jgi:Flp pilus assembly protein TadG